MAGSASSSVAGDAEPAAKPGAASDAATVKAVKDPQQAPGAPGSALQTAEPAAKPRGASKDEEDADKTSKTANGAEAPGATAAEAIAAGKVEQQEDRASTEPTSPAEPTSPKPGEEAGLTLSPGSGSGVIRTVSAPPAGAGALLSTGGEPAEPAQKKAADGSKAKPTDKKKPPKSNKVKPIAYRMASDMVSNGLLHPSDTKVMREALLESLERVEKQGGFDSRAKAAAEQGSNAKLTSGHKTPMLRDNSSEDVLGPDGAAAAADGGRVGLQGGDGLRNDPSSAIPIVVGPDASLSRLPARPSVELMAPEGGQSLLATQLHPGAAANGQHFVGLAASPAPGPTAIGLAGGSATPGPTPGSFFYNTGYGGSGGGSGGGGGSGSQDVQFRQHQGGYGHMQPQAYQQTLSHYPNAMEMVSHLTPNRGPVQPAAQGQQYMLQQTHQQQQQQRQTPTRGRSLTQPLGPLRLKRGASARQGQFQTAGQRHVYQQQVPRRSAVKLNRRAAGVSSLEQAQAQILRAHSQAPGGAGFNAAMQNVQGAQLQGDYGAMMPEYRPVYLNQAAPPPQMGYYIPMRDSLDGQQP